MPFHTNPRLGRRTLLKGAGVGLAVAGVGGLSACNSGTGGTGGEVAQNNAVQLPTYMPYEGLTPDLPGDEKTGVDPAYRNFPTENPTTVEGKPGDGSTVTGMAEIYAAVPPGADSNQWWAGLNERLGVTLDMRMVGNADYVQVFPTVIAGGDIPDVMRIQPVANMPQLLERRFTPLSEHLAGDAIAEYPNLANVPTRHWKGTVFNGGIYGIPIPRGAVGSYNFVRADIIKARGLNPEPKSYAEFLELCKGLTNPKERRWALDRSTTLRQYLARSNGEPNVWRNEGGKLTHAYETEEYAQTVADMIEIWKAGVMHPDAFSPTQPFKQLFNGGTVAMNLHDGYPGWNQYIVDNAKNPDFELGLMPVYAREGGKLATWHQGSGLYSYTGIAQQDDPERVKMILRVLNWLAAPFGTAEYKYRLYGEEGREHTLSASGPTLNQEGITNTGVPIRYLADSPYTIFQPGRPADADTQHAYQTQILADSVANPVLGLYSEASASKNAPADKALVDAVSEIILGRQPVTQLDALVSTWRSSVGDEMRREYEEGLQAGNVPGSTPS